MTHVAKIISLFLCLLLFACSLSACGVQIVLQEEHVHQWGAQQAIGNYDGLACDQKTYYRVCQECQVSEFITGAHEYDAKGICALCGAPECPVEKIEITNKGQKNSEALGDYIVVRADENGDRKLQIEYLVYPNEASIKDVKFVWEKMNGVSVDENGLVTFTQSASIKVKVVATDGSGVEDSLLILAP